MPFKPTFFIAIMALSFSHSVAYADSPQQADEKTLYAIGANVAKSLSVFSLSEAEFEYVMKGIRETRTGGKPGFDIMSYNTKVQELARARRKVLGDRQAGIGKEFLEKAAAEQGAHKTASGMVYMTTREGAGTSPKPTDTVKVNYRGMLIDGKEFDSSYKRGKPTEFRLDGVIQCWTEGLQKMKPGGASKFVCPAALAYGDTGAGDLILPGSTLVFEVELLEVKK